MKKDNAFANLISTNLFEVLLLMRDVEEGFPGPVPLVSILSTNTKKKVSSNIFILICLFVPFNSEWNTGSSCKKKKVYNIWLRTGFRNRDIVCCIASVWIKLVKFGYHMEINSIPHVGPGFSLEAFDHEGNCHWIPSNVNRQKQYNWMYVFQLDL